MPGLLDIHNIYPELAGTAEQRELALMSQQRPGFQGVADKSIARLRSRAPQRAFQATGNRGLLSPRQNLQREMVDIDPTDPNAGQKLLEAARQYDPSRIPLIMAAMEKQRQQGVEETRLASAEERAWKSLGIDEDRARAYISNLEFEQEASEDQQRRAWRQLGLDERQMRVAESNQRLGQEQAVRDATKFFWESSDRGDTAERRQKLAELLEAKEMPELAEAARSPDSSVNSVIQAMVQEDANRVRQHMAELELNAEALTGSPPSESDVDSFVVALLNDVKTGKGFQPGADNEAEVSNLIRTFYVNGGYVLHRINPITAKEEAFRFIDKFSEFKDLTEKDVETEEEDQNLLGGQPSVTPTQNARQPLGSFYRR